MSLSGALDLLDQTVSVFEASSGTTKERLIQACVAHLYLLGTERQHLPQDLQVEWDAIKAALTKVPKREPESSYARTVQAMSEGEVQQIVKRIYDLRDKVDRLLGGYKPGQA